MIAYISFWLTLHFRFIDIHWIHYFRKLSIGFDNVNKSSRWTKDITFWGPTLTVITYYRLVFCALFGGPVGPTGPHILEFFTQIWKVYERLVLFLEFLAKFLDFLLKNDKKTSCNCWQVASLPLFTANYSFKAKILYYHQVLDWAS